MAEEKKTKTGKKKTEEKENITETEIITETENAVKEEVEVKSKEPKSKEPKSKAKPKAKPKPKPKAKTESKVKEDKPKLTKRQIVLEQLKKDVNIYFRDVKLGSTLDNPKIIGNKLLLNGRLYQLDMLVFKK